jgi:hypothetical protein
MAISKKIITDFFDQYSAHITHVAVAHSSLHPHNATQAQIDSMLATFQQQLRHFTNYFSQAVHGKKAQRKPYLYKPLYLITIEGAHASALAHETIHAHFALGNLPSELSVDELKQIFTECWVEKAKIANDDIWFQPVYAYGPQGWNDYITKEIKRGNMEAWDMDNSWIPHAALAKA